MAGEGTNPEIRLDEEFEKLVPEPLPSERRELARSLLTDGCLDPLVAWRPPGEEAEPPILLDGHTRREICDEYEIEYQVREIDLASREDARLRVIWWHLGKRNLNTAGRCEIATGLRPLLDDAAEARKRRGGSVGGRGGKTKASAKVPRKSAEPSSEELSEAESIVNDMLRDADIDISGDARKQAAELVDVGRDTYESYQAIKNARESEDEFPSVRKHARYLYDDLRGAAPEYSVSGAYKDLKSKRQEARDQKAEEDRQVEREKKILDAGRKLQGDETPAGEGRETAGEEYSGKDTESPGEASDKDHEVRSSGSSGIPSRPPQVWTRDSLPVWSHGLFQDYVEDNIPEKSVRLLLTDPPYGSDKGFEGDKSPKEAVEAVEAMFDAFEEKLAPDCHVVFFCAAPQHKLMREVLERKAPYLTERDMLVWMKNKPGNPSETHGTGRGDPYSMSPTHEFALHASRGKTKLKPRGRAGHISSKLKKEKHHDHPTEKPLAMLQEIIRSMSAAGDLVADPFGGVASTIVAALGLPELRRSWGCEYEPRYHRTGTGRIQEALEARRSVAAPAAAFDMLLRDAVASAEDGAPVEDIGLSKMPDYDPLPGIPATIWGFGEPPEGFFGEAAAEASRSLGLTGDNHPAGYYIRLAGVSSNYKDERWEVYAEVEDVDSSEGIERIPESLGEFGDEIEAEEAIREHARARGERLGVHKVYRDIGCQEVPDFWDG